MAVSFLRPTSNESGGQSSVARFAYMQRSLQHDFLVRAVGVLHALEEQIDRSASQFIGRLGDYG